MAEYTLTPQGEAVLRRAVTAIHNDLLHWNQGTFVDTGVCGTTACLAGWIVANETGTPLDDLLDDDVQVENMALDLLFGENTCKTDVAGGFSHDVFYATGTTDLDEDISVEPTAEWLPLDGYTESAFPLFVEHLTKMTGVEFELS